MIVYIILLLFVLLRIPSLFEPFWYGDEGVYQVIGMGMQLGRAMYTEVWDNKPPFLFLIYAFFSGEQQPIRILSLLFGLATVFIFFLLSQKIFKNKLFTYCITGAFGLLYATPFLEGNIANTENFMLLPILLGMMFLFNAKDTSRQIFVAGLLFSIAFLFKIVGLFDFCTAFYFLLFRKKYKQLFPLTLGFSIPIAFTVFYFFSIGHVEPFFVTVFTGNIGYVVYANQFIVPQGFLILKIILLFSGLSFLYFWKSKISNTMIFVSIWFLWSLFNVYFSGRNFTHYFLLLLPSACLLTGIILQKLFPKKFYVPTFFVIGSILSMYVFTRTIWYYSSFFSYIFGKTSESQYLASFDPITIRNYEVANYIQKNVSPHEDVFVWGNSPQIYKLADKLPPGRFSAAYHITASDETRKETEEAFRRVNPKFVIILPDPQTFPYSLEGYQLKTSIAGSSIFERI